MTAPVQLKILLIDDNPDDRALAIRALKRSFPNLQVEEIIDATGLERALEKGDFDLVITDYHLYWTNGLENLRAIKVHYPECPVIIFTGTGTEEIAVEAMKSGLDDYLLKSPKYFSRLPGAVSAALERMKQARALKYSEKKYSSLMNTVPDAVLLADSRGTVLLTNKAARALLPKYEGRITGQAWRDLLPVGEASSFLEAFDRAVETGITVTQIDRINNRDLESVFSPVRDAKGRIANVTIVARDVTERRQSEEALRRSEERLRQSQKLEAIGRLAAGITHDFNNLLTVITGFTELVLQRLTAHDPLRQDVEEIRKATEKARALSRQLLIFSRQQVLQLQILDLNQVIADMENMLLRLRGENVRLDLILAPELKPVSADLNQISQVLMNLIINASEAMPSGGRVTLKTENLHLQAHDTQLVPEARAGNFVCLSIEDTGCGIERKNLPHIFEPFFTTKKPEKGSGLGLSMVYGIVNQHDGWISVWSDPGRGSVFKVYLPAASVEVEGQTPATVPLPEQTSNRKRTHGMKDGRSVRNR